MLWCPWRKRGFGVGLFFSYMVECKDDLSRDARVAQIGVRFKFAPLFDAAHSQLRMTTKPGTVSRTTRYRVVRRDGLISSLGR